MSTSRIFGIVLVVVGVVVMGAIALPALGNVGGSGQKVIVCDLTVTIAGNFYDSGLLQDTNSEVVKDPQSSNCHEKTIFDYFNSASVFPQAGLFFKSNVEVYGKAYINGKEIAESTHFVVVSPQGTPNQPFSDHVVFKTIPKGSDIEIRVFTSLSKEIARTHQTFTI